MIQRDLKIGLIAGLVIVAGIVFLLATDPRLSTEARMTNNDDSIDGLESLDSNNIYVEERILDQVPFSSNSYSNNQYEQIEPLQQEETITEVAEQGNQEESDYPALQHTQEQTHPPTPNIRT